MINLRCKNCDWWDNQHVSVQFIPKTEIKPNPGFCRRRKSGVVVYENHHFGAHPVMDAEEFCGEYKGDR
jgi:hypothetical protein